MADGTSRAWSLDGAPQRLALDATPWTVTFFNPDDSRHRVTFAALHDWKDSADARVKYFSGTAHYETRFAWANPRTDARVYLDLGDVRQIAAVALNGRDLGVLWKKPFRIDITDALRGGENTLVVRVANMWFNRFIGDEQLPDDTGANAQGVLEAWPEWVLTGTSRPEPGRVTLVNRKQVKRDAPLHASGLLGPVAVTEERVLR
jgi:hypothetical protein